MLSTQSFEARFVLVLALGLVVPLALQSGCAEKSELCEQGKLVDSESGAVCVFRRDSALVIEGGFECPASFGYRIETENAIACGERPLTALPDSVCREIEDCVPMGVLEPTTHVDGSAMNECLQTCTEPQDCVTQYESLSPQGSDFNADNYACVEGVCEYLGCNDDLECMNNYAEPEQWHCHAVHGETGKRCTSLCDEKSDCNDSSEAPQFAVFDCIDEVCQYTGCISDESCPANAECVERGAGVPECHYSCETAAECEAKVTADGLGLITDVPALGEVSFACVDGWCETHATGCADDAVCESGADGRTWRCDIE